MNRWLMIRRLRGPAFLLMFGVTALLHEWHILSFGQSWPLYLVLAGVLTLAERAAFQEPDPSQMPPQLSSRIRRERLSSCDAERVADDTFLAGYGYCAGAAERH